MKKAFLLLTVALLCTAFTAETFYPIDGYTRTGIKRLKRLEQIKNGEISDKSTLPPGAFKSYLDIKLNLLSKAELGLDTFLKKDAAFQEKISALFKGLDKSYSLTVLDISNLDNIRYASRNETAGYQPGSVGKLAVLTGLFDQLAKIYPDSFEKRLDLLRTRSVKSGQWGMTDAHTIPIYHLATKKLERRQVAPSDVFTLFEWADFMMSVSNNGAASIVWREVLLMRAFGQKYPALTQAEADAYFKNTSKTELMNLGNEVVNLPLRNLGITEDEWRLGTFFTRGAGAYVPAKGGSTGTPIGLMKFLIQLEQGKVIDAASSLEMKRLMYMTDSRIRYAQSAALKPAAVYFKSGSLYKCDKTKDEPCGKYKGNVQNYMNSVAIIEHPADSSGTPGAIYMVALMTNVLRKNSATDHMNLAAKIDAIIRE